MRRRTFITLLGGAATWPLAARAQQSTTPVVGILSPLAPGSGEYLLDAFRRGLGESSYVEGQNVTIDYQFAAGRFDRFREMSGGALVLGTRKGRDSPLTLPSPERRHTEALFHSSRNARHFGGGIGGA
jgi:hypothetical protein